MRQIADAVQLVKKAVVPAVDHAQLLLLFILQAGQFLRVVPADRQQKLPAVRRPGQRANLSLYRGQGAGFASMGGQQVHLGWALLFSPVGEKSDRRAVR